jgi:hypothetical protein
MMNLSALRSLSCSNTGGVKMHLQLYLRPSCLNTGLLRTESMGVIGGVWGMAPARPSVRLSKVGKPPDRAEHVIGATGYGGAMRLLKASFLPEGFGSSAPILPSRCGSGR